MAEKYYHRVYFSKVHIKNILEVKKSNEYIITKFKLKSYINPTCIKFRSLYVFLLILNVTFHCSITDKCSNISLKCRIVNVASLKAPKAKGYR